MVAAMVGRIIKPASRKAGQRGDRQAARSVGMKSLHAIIYRIVYNCMTVTVKP
jgi:hypothetical protein